MPILKDKDKQDKKHFIDVIMLKTWNTQDHRIAI